LLRSALVGGLKIPGLGGFRVASGIFASEHDDDSSSVERSGFCSSPLAARRPFPTRFRPGTKRKKKTRDPRLALLQTITSRQKFERDLPKILKHAGALPESLQNTSSEKKKTTTTQKSQKTPGGVVQRALFVESSSSPVRFERFFWVIMSSAFSFVGEKKTFEEEEEEEEKNIAGRFLVFFQHPTNEGKKRRKKKEGKKTQRTHRYRA